MSGKSRLQQICVLQEVLPGLAPTQAALLTSANARMLVSNVNLQFDIEQYEREIYIASLSGLNTIAGVVEANLSFSFELSGSSTQTTTAEQIASTIPVWAPVMRACSLEQVPLYRAAPTAAFAGPVFEHGTIVKNAGDTIRARIFGDVWANGGSGVIRYVPLVKGATANFTSADTITDIGPDACLVGGATMDLSTSPGQANSAGQGWQPATATLISFDTSATTGTPPATEGDVLVGTSGAVITPFFRNKTATGSPLVPVPGTLATGAQTGVQFILMDGTPLTTGSEVFTNRTATGSVTVHATSNIQQLQCPTVAFGIVQDGRFVIIKGCRGNVSIAGRIGQPAIVTVNFKGQLAATPGSIAAVANVQADSPVPPKCMGMTVKVGSMITAEPGFESQATEHIPRVTGFKLDYGAEVTLERDATSSTGVTVAQHAARRKTTFELNPVVRPEASFPWLKKVTNGEQVRVRLAIGTAVKNNFTLQIPGWKPEGPNSQDDSGFLRDALTGRCSGTRRSGQDGFEREFCLAYNELSTGF